MVMLKEFEDWANWVGVLDCVKEDLFPPLVLELLEDYRCQLSRRGLKAILSKKNRRSMAADLDRLDEDSCIEDVAQWLWHRDRNDAVVVLEAIEEAMQEVDTTLNETPTPQRGIEVVRFLLTEFYERR